MMTTYSMMKLIGRAAAIILCSTLVLSCSGGSDRPSASEQPGPEPEAENTASPGPVMTVEPDQETADMEIERILEQMTLEEKVGQMIMTSYRIWGDAKKTDITELNDEIREALGRYHYGGVLLFAENFKDAEQTLRLVSQMQTANSTGSSIPLLTAVDQEGGYVVRVNYGTAGIGNMALCASGSTENAGTMASIYGKELGLLGISTDFAPVMDVNNEPANPVIGIRSFSDDPVTAAAYGAAYVQGLHDQGTIAVLKHFPGHGNTDTDSHTGFPCIRSTYEELKNCELIPFRKAIDAGADMIMTAHIQYPQIETETYTSVSTGEQVYLPATMSRTILTDILRNDMGFEGVIVSDALDMAAIADHFSDEDMLCMTVNAGADLLLFPTVKSTAMFRDSIKLTEMALRLAEEGKISAERIDEAVRRILKLKKKYGLLEKRDFTVTDKQIREAVNDVGSEEHLEKAWNLAEQALTLYRNERNALPLTVSQGEKTLILFANNAQSRYGSGQHAVQILQEQGIIQDASQVSLMVHKADNTQQCMDAAEAADNVILVYRTYSEDCMDARTNDGFSAGLFDRIIEQRHADGRTVIFVSAQLPYDAARFNKADAVLLTYGSSYMPELTENPYTGQMPNLPAALCACFGMSEVTGRLPVKLPQLDENGRIIKGS
ncbi:MAG: hypothetical protein IIZ57_09970 [Solobacterium sp.]|nr:hypothetical protein [Solobacterium sp.]